MRRDESKCYSTDDAFTKLTSASHSPYYLSALLLKYQNAYTSMILCQSILKQLYHCCCLHIGCIILKCRISSNVSCLTSIIQSWHNNMSRPREAQQNYKKVPITCSSSLPGAHLLRSVAQQQESELHSLLCTKTNSTVMIILDLKVPKQS